MFWAVAFGLAAITAALLVLALLGRGSGGVSAGGSDVRVYRDQLDEVERDLARGILSPEEGARVRTEVARRLLEADRAARTATVPGTAPRKVSLAAAGAAALLVTAGALAVYQWLGAPGYPDLPLRTRIEMAETARADRPSQAEAEARAQPEPTGAVDPSFVAMLEQLRGALETRPDDLRGHLLLARTEARLGNFAPAARAQQRAIDLKGAEAEADDYSDLAEYLYLAAGGYVSPEAETALTRALQLDGRHGPARYYAGLLYAQTGRPDLAFQLWRDLLEEGPESAPWIEPVRAGIAELAARAGVRYDIPAAGPRQPGPSAEDIANAESMSDEDRAAMIRSMVAGLSDRLATEGGPPEDWARLIAAYGVLGETDQAEAILAEALAVFADSDTALATIRAAAQQAGMTRMILPDILGFAAALPRHGAVAGLDLGTVTLGVAVSDGLRSIATPLETIKRKKFGLDAARLLEITTARDIRGLVLGLPLNMDGSEGPRVQSTRAFARNLERLTDLPITFWDERLSTVAAERALLEADTSRKRRAEVIDHVAAGYILQGALDRMAHLKGRA